jgi:diguanylate cyclase (GGDEF)-like protein/PAS domain S-box-containing protein
LSKKLSMGTVMPIGGVQHSKVGSVRTAALVPVSSRAGLAVGGEHESCQVCYDVTGRVVWASAAFARWLDRPLNEITSQTVPALFGAESWGTMQPLVAHVLATSNPAGYMRLKAVAGERERWVRVQLFPWVAASGEIIGVMDCEVAEHVRETDSNENSAHERRIETLVNNTPHPMTYLDLNLRYVFANNIFLERVARTREQVLGRMYHEVRDPEVHELFAPMLKRALEGQRASLEWKPVYTGGARRWVRSEFFPDFDTDGTVKGIYVMATDIHDLKLAHERVRAMANTDALTGLPNRPALREELDARVTSHKPEAKSFAVLFIDLDAFKQFNDSHGHRFGDAVLVRVARALESVMREQDLIGRLAGDEFMALLNNTDRAEAKRVANRILDQVGKIDSVETRSVRVSASVGIAVFPEDGTSFDALFRASDAAMYKAKQNGKNRVWDLPSAA